MSHKIHPVFKPQNTPAALHRGVSGSASGLCPPPLGFWCQWARVFSTRGLLQNVAHGELCSNWWKTEYPRHPGDEKLYFELSYIRRLTGVKQDCCNLYRSIFSPVNVFVLLKGSISSPKSSFFLSCVRFFLSLPATRCVKGDKRGCSTPWRRRYITSHPPITHFYQSTRYYKF